MAWHWTDDLARLLQDASRVDQAILLRWRNAPIAVRSDREPHEVAEALLAEDPGDDHLAA